MATLRLAIWSSTLTYASLPPAVISATHRSLYNYLGCALGGSHHPTTVTASRALSPFFGKETSTLLGQQRRADASHAALINGIASHVHDYDDTHLETIIHPTGVVVSAVLAVVEAGMGRGGMKGKGWSGEEVLVAVVAVCLFLYIFCGGEV